MLYSVSAQQATARPPPLVAGNTRQPCAVTPRVLRCGAPPALPRLWRETRGGAARAVRCAGVRFPPAGGCGQLQPYSLQEIRLLQMSKRLFGAQDAAGTRRPAASSARGASLRGQTGPKTRWGPPKWAAPTCKSRIFWSGTDSNAFFAARHAGCGPCLPPPAPARNMRAAAPEGAAALALPVAMQPVRELATRRPARA